jgi:hypothetical protein
VEGGVRGLTLGREPSRNDRAFTETRSQEENRMGLVNSRVVTAAAVLALTSPAYPGPNQKSSRAVLPPGPTVPEDLRAGCHGPVADRHGVT